MPDSDDAPDGDVVVTSVEELGIMIAWLGFTPRRTARTRCLCPEIKCKCQILMLLHKACKHKVKLEYELLL